MPSELHERFLPIFDRIRENAAIHERDRTLPQDEVRALADAGFGALRLPSDEDGRGVSLAEFFGLLIRLATADSNLPQIWRNHIAFVEDRLQPAPADQNARWHKVIANGALVGGAWSERSGDFGAFRTVLTGDRLVTGTKYYSTGSIFADWISVLAKHGDEFVIALVDAGLEGVEVVDDWSGIGQRTTGSGTARFAGAVADDVFPFADRAPYQEAVYQLVHLATLAGIARAAQRDVVEAVRNRTRAYPHGVGGFARNDAQVLAVVGKVAGFAHAAEAAVLSAAGALDAAADAAIAGHRDATSVHEATIVVYEAQIAVSDLVLRATTLLYDALSSSALDAGTLLDRHWRNARTVTSHNPRIYKERLVGDWHVNAVPPSLGFDQPVPEKEAAAEAVAPRLPPAGSAGGKPAEPAAVKYQR